MYLPLPNLAGRTGYLKQEGRDTLLLLSSRQELPLAVADLSEQQDWALARVTADTIECILDASNGSRYVAIAWDLDPFSQLDWTLAERIQAHPQLCRLPMLLFDAPEPWFSSGESASEASVTQVMIKPFGGETLLQAVARLLPDGESGVVLAVDDDPEALNLYQRMIRKALPHHAFRAANSGLTALHLLEDGLMPALVILDLMMPEMDGFALLERLRAAPATRHIPVLILSGKMLSFDDIRRLSQHDVLLHSKHVLDDHDLETVLKTLTGSDFTLNRQTSELVKLAMAYIHQHYIQPIAREDICQVLGISPNYLSRLFRQELGLTLTDYTNRYRMTIAKQLLIDTTASITEIAQQVGFDDPAYFSRVFARVAGVSPRDYRQANIAHS